MNSLDSVSDQGFGNRLDPRLDFERPLAFSSRSTNPGAVMRMRKRVGADHAALRQIARCAVAGRRRPVTG
jgi:hypothetical protein